jgi:hypothetical protein
MEQSNHHIDQDKRVVPISVSNLTIQWSDNESEDEYARCENPMADDGSSVPLHDTIEIKLAAHQISADLSIQVGDAQQRIEEIDLEDHEDDLRSTVDLNYLCARTLTLICSILASVIRKPCTDRYFMLCLDKIRLMMAKFWFFIGFQKEVSII